MRKSSNAFKTRTKGKRPPQTEGAVANWDVGEGEEGGRRGKGGPGEALPEAPGSGDPHAVGWSHRTFIFCCCLLFINFSAWAAVPDWKTCGDATSWRHVGLPLEMRSCGRVL